VVDRDEADGQQERRPHLVQRHQRQERVEPDVHVGESAADVHEHVRTDHQAEADRRRPGDLRAQRRAQDEQHDDGGQLTPQQQPPADPAREPDGRQRRRVDREDRGDDPVMC
jgi:hypothetical protein